MSAEEMLTSLAQLGNPRVLVLGDLILDRYTWGNAERISQEAPVIVLRAEHRESRLGGAANVGNMLRGLGAEVSCLGIVGTDDAGAETQQLLQQAGIDADGVVTVAGRPTTVKERFIGRASMRHPNQILRVDHEVRDALQEEHEAALERELLERLNDHDALLISDYDKGVCSPRLVRAAIAAAQTADVPVLVDPLRGADLKRYRGATLLKPNRLEAELCAGRPIDIAGDAMEAAQGLCRQLDLQLIAITLDSEGMVLANQDEPPQVFPTRRREVYDITGAGDVVFAMLGICLACNVAPPIAAQLGNIAGGLEVEKTGVSLVTRDEIRRELLSELNPGGEKILTLEEAARRCRQHQANQETVVFTNGCFDLLHIGHATYLAEAAAMGDRLVVGVNSDAGVRRLKGPSRPVLGEQERSAMLAALACVDFVVIFDDDTPHRLLEALRPDVLVKGGTYAPEQVVGREVVESYGGQVRVMSLVDGISTSHIVESIAGGKSVRPLDRERDAGWRWREAS